MTGPCKQHYMNLKQADQISMRRPQPTQFCFRSDSRLGSWTITWAPAGSTAKKAVPSV